MTRTIFIPVLGTLILVLVFTVFTGILLVRVMSSNRRCLDLYEYTSILLCSRFFLQYMEQAALQTTVHSEESLLAVRLNDVENQFVFADSALHIIRLLVPSDSDEAVVSVDHWPSKMRFSFPGRQQL